MDNQDQSGAAGDNGNAGGGQSAEESLRPVPGLEQVQEREFISENVSISGRHFVRCSPAACARLASRSS